MKAIEKKTYSLQRCPRCGGLHLVLFRIGYPKIKKKFYYQCSYCKFKSDRGARTRWGAKRIWNRMTNISVKEINSVSCKEDN